MASNISSANGIEHFIKPIPKQIKPYDQTPTKNPYTKTTSSEVINFKPDGCIGILLTKYWQLLSHPHPLQTPQHPKRVVCHGTSTMAAPIRNKTRGHSRPCSHHTRPEWT